MYHTILLGLYYPKKKNEAKKLPIILQKNCTFACLLYIIKRHFIISFSKAACAAASCARKQNEIKNTFEKKVLPERTRQKWPFFKLPALYAISCERAATNYQ
jgi:hypothetical protein